MKKSNLFSIMLGIIVSILCIYAIVKFVTKNEYKKIIEVNDFNSLQKHFVLNSKKDGSDPTNGMVNFHFPFKKDSNGQPIPNINGDVLWQNISNDPNTVKLINNAPNNKGVRIQIDNEIDANNNVGAPRLISRKMYKGGLFIFDVKHIPMGCGIWPAIWMNGFVGDQDYIREPENGPNYNESIRKLAKSTNTSVHTCNSNSLLDSASRQPHPQLSKYLGKPVFPAQWPAGGEIDIIEQINFSNTNTMSIHGGPNCEVSTKYGNSLGDGDPTKAGGNPPQNYKDLGLGSACGQTYGPDGPYSGCKDDEHKLDTGTFTINGDTRYTCPSSAGINSGNTQVAGPFGSFGESFNNMGGGVYAVQWVPKEKVYIYFFPHIIFSHTQLKSDGGPLSDNPNPDKWDKISDYTWEGNKVKTLSTSYRLDNPNAQTKGCDFNFMEVVINITVNGDWSKGSIPDYCSVDYKSGPENADEYTIKCLNASVDDAMTNNGVDPTTQCFDGGLSASGRGVLSKPHFYADAYFDIDSIRIFQKEGDDNVW